MFTIILFMFGVIFLFRKKYASLLTVIMILSTTFLQLQIVESSFITLPGLNTHDFGFLLYILFFVQIAYRYGCCFTGKVQRIVTFFMLYLVFNGIFDIMYYNTSIFDVVKYLKNWILLSIVYIYPYINLDSVIKSFRQIYIITLLLCVFVTVCMILKLDLGILKYSLERGIKPPPDCMWFSAFAFFGIWGEKKMRNIVETLIFISPIVMSLKMTYAVTVVLIFFLYIFLKKNMSSIKKIVLFLLMLCSVFFVLYLNSDFNERLTSVAAETSDINQQERSGNFSYRILHAQERLDFIKKDPIMLIRGFGYLHERNLKRTLFVFGTNNGEVQLDTGDIVWSLFFIRLGLFGIFLYIIMYCSIIKYYYKNRYRKICLIFASMMIAYLTFTSLGNCIISYSYFFIYPILFLNVNQKRNQLYLENKFSSFI